MLGICKQGLTDVAADDLWGSAEDLCHMHATELKVFTVKDRHKTRYCRSNQHSHNEQHHVQFYSTFLTTDSTLCIYLCIVRDKVKDNRDKTCRMCNADGGSPILYINLYMNQHFPKKEITRPRLIIKSDKLVWIGEFSKRPCLKKKSHANVKLDIVWWQYDLLQSIWLWAIPSLQGSYLFVESRQGWIKDPIEIRKWATNINWDEGASMLSHTWNTVLQKPAKLLSPANLTGLLILILKKKQLINDTSWWHLLRKTADVRWNMSK